MRIKLCLLLLNFYTFKTYLDDIEIEILVKTCEILPLRVLLVDSSISPREINQEII